MERNKRLQLQQALVFLFLFFIAICEASASFISGDGLSSHGITGRHLLQGKTIIDSASCPVNFEFANYTIVTSQCKGPRFPADVCCKAFKEFTCPYRDNLNDPSSDCSTVMYSYLNPSGNYPPSLFASMCREGKEGLNCTGVPRYSDKQQPSGAPGFHALASFFVGFITILFMLF